MVAGRGRITLAGVRVSCRRMCYNHPQTMKPIPRTKTYIVIHRYVLYTREVVTDAS